MHLEKGWVLKNPTAIRGVGAILIQEPNLIYYTCILQAKLHASLAGIECYADWYCGCSGFGHTGKSHLSIVCSAQNSDHEKAILTTFIDSIPLYRSLWLIPEQSNPN